MALADCPGCHHSGRRTPGGTTNDVGNLTPGSRYTANTLFDREQVDGRKLDANPRINNDAFVEDPVKNIE